jgi:formylglycine-generating enzyme required for sulfatase activity
MRWRKLFVRICFVELIFTGSFALADCPSADLTGDCFVDFEDFAVIGAQWLNGYDWNDVNTLANQWLATDPCVPDDMVYIPDGEFEMGNHVGYGYSDERPVHAVLLDAFFMSSCEITNQQYCDYLNSAYPAQIKVYGGVVYASSDDPCDYPYCDTHGYDAHSQIDYNDVSGTFSVRTKGEPPRDMNDDPMVEVSWYGAAAYCNWRSSEEGYEDCYNLSAWDCNFSKHGYRLPTEAEWEYAARGGEHNPYYRYPWGDNTISHKHANYFEESTFSFHPDWDDGTYPYTSVVGSFSANGYGLYDMAGNVFEWCNDWYDSAYYSVSPYDNPQGPPSGTYRVLRGGTWNVPAIYCRVAFRLDQVGPNYRYYDMGFRIVLDLE